MTEPFDAPSRLLGVASKVSRLDSEPTPTDQSPLTKPGQQRGDVGHRIDGLATLVFERVSKGDEELLGLVRLGKHRRVKRHVTIVHRLTSYFEFARVPL